MVGFLENVHMELVDGVESMVADFQVTDPKMREVFKNLNGAKRLDKLGYSIDVTGHIADGKEPGTQDVVSIDEAYALDIVTYPAAGGRNLDLLEAERQRQKKTKEAVKMNKWIKFLEAFAPSLLKGVDLKSITEAKIAELGAKALDLLLGKVEKTPLGEAKIQENLVDKLKAAIAAMKEGKVQEAMDMIMSALSDLAMEGESLPTETVEEDDDAKKAAAAEAEKKTKEADEAKKVAAKEAADKKKKEEEDAAAAAKADENATEAEKAQRAKESKREKELAELKETVEKQGKQLHESEVEKSAGIVASKLSESQLPMALREEISAEMKGKVLTEAEVEKRIGRGKDLVAKLSEAGNIRGMGTTKVKVGMTESDFNQLRMDLTVDPDIAHLKESGSKYQGIKPFRGLREAWGSLTGDWDVRFDRRRALDDKRMYEAVTSDFPRVLGDSITRHLLRRYRGFPDHWRKAVSVKALNDFRTQRPIQWGTFPDLATVAEDATFATLATPSEREATYVPEKRGGLFSVTREMILQDDLRKLRDLGPMLARAAVRTLNQHVFNRMIGNVGGGGVNTDILTYQAGVTFTGPNANLGTDALDADSLRAARIRLRLQQDDDSNETLGLRAKYLWVPLELEPAAQVLVNSELVPGSANNDVNDNFKSVEVIGIPYIGDVNDFFLQTAQEELETIELGFIEGEEEPQVLIQDDPRVGDVFSRERITYKVRHEYGSAVVNHRGLDGNIVP